MVYLQRDRHSERNTKKTSLLYVIMMSANPVTSFPAQSVIDMMNEENFFF